ncbi:MAG: Holliday junction resolvase RuvX [Bacilli bacterium]|nr:Holliday junction resolvase RuvX [Bacilli bacterium]
MDNKKHIYLGLDLGTVTLGVSISRTGIIASGYEEFRFPSCEWHIPLQEVERIVKLENVDIIVLGLPLNMDGSESEMSQNARKFGKEIKNLFPKIKIYMQDERLSSVESNSYLIEGGISRKHRKKVVDKVAAQVILERYLERM